VLDGVRQALGRELSIGHRVGRAQLGQLWLEVALGGGRILDAAVQQQLTERRRDAEGAPEIRCRFGVALPNRDLHAAHTAERTPISASRSPHRPAVQLTRERSEPREGVGPVGLCPTGGGTATFPRLT
jgi:hypothetical protein